MDLVINVVVPLAIMAKKGPPTAYTERFYNRGNQNSRTIDIIKTLFSLSVSLSISHSFPPQSKRYCLYSAFQIVTTDQ